MHVGMRSKLVSTTAMQASPTECHSWQGKEQWIAYKEFADALRSPPLDVLLNCESWQVFPILAIMPLLFRISIGAQVIRRLLSHNLP